MPEGNEMVSAHHELGDFAVLGEATAEFERRIPRVKHLQFLDYTPADPYAADALALVGTVTFFLFRAGSPMLERVKKALVAADGSDLELMRELKSTIGKRPAMPLAKAVDLLKRQPVIGALQYAGRTLANNLFLPEDVEVCLIPLPYNGGALAQRSFELVQAFREEGSGGELDGFMVRSSPRLTPAEAEALAVLPEDMNAFNVIVPMCYALTVVLIAVVVTTLTSICPHTPPHPMDVHLTDEEVAKLGPVATSRRLLDLRREMLQKNYAG
jgi:hypothetical protein